MNGPDVDLYAWAAARELELLKEAGRGGGVRRGCPFLGDLGRRSLRSSATAMCVS